MLCLMLLEVLSSSTTIQQPPPAGPPVTLHLRCRQGSSCAISTPRARAEEQSRTKLSLLSSKLPHEEYHHDSPRLRKRQC
mmetsp:Transcript_12883/g.16466  ORF Transcript_12883/g.16466 Transcript_12883/m.16466 type:complete len:80 (+) Transcript_12883:18-257(+)